jgi:DnaD/phage-associated family protein
MLGMDESSCEKGIEAAVARGVFLTAQLSLEGKAVTAYFANLEADVEAIEQLKTNSLSGTMGATVKRTPNIFELYEQNIGIITPMMAEELKDAQRAYPEEWIEEAFREAVKGRKQNWKYVSRILERWSAEGKGSGAYRPGAVTDDPDKYVKGRFGRIVRR